MAKKSEIKIHVQLDDNKLPEKIEWEATDAEFKGRKESKAINISLWDKEENVTMGIDLWTKEMLISDMNIHTHQTLLKLADTYNRATQNEDVSIAIRKFADELAEQLDLYKK